MNEKITVEKGTEERVVKTLCSMCATHCGIDVHVKGNTIVRIEPMKEHPLRRLCIKATAIPDLQYSKDRLLYPLKRFNGDWKRISWDEALDTIILKLSYLEKRYGPETLAIYYGHEMFVKETLGLQRLFAQAYGTPNIMSAGIMCGCPKIHGNRITCGGDNVHELGRTKCMICWALNSWHSQTAARSTIDDFKKKGVKLITVDPRRTYEAKIADLHLRPRPSTDLALLLAMINLIISERLYDKDFVEKWTVGFDKLVEAVKEYTPKWAEGVTWVPAEDIEKCARMYATIKPACIGTMAAMEQTTNSFQFFRASCILAAITGNLDVAGGNKIVPAPPSGLVRMNPESPDYILTKKTFSADKVPLWEELIKEAHGAFFADTVFTGKPYPVKALIVQGGNLVRSYPNTNKIIRALKELDLLVVVDIFMTDLGELADVVLPACSFLEHRWAHAYYFGHLPLISVADKVFEPSGESWPDSKFWIELGRRMGYEDFFPWQDDEQALEDSLKKAVGKTFKDFEDSPQGFWYAPKVPDRPASEREKPFDTPSGKVEIYSERLEKMGYPPLPVPYEEPLESPVTKPELFREYPLMLLTGTRTHVYEHTWGRNLPTLRAAVPDPLIEIHPRDAEKYGVKHGEWAFVENRRGRVKMKVNVSEDIMEGIISVPHGWGGDANINLLTNDEERGPVTETATNKGFACRLRKID